MGLRLNPAYQPCADPWSTSCFNRRLSDARTADDGSAQDNSVNQSAKVALVNQLLSVASAPMKIGVATIILWTSSQPVRR